MVRIHGASSQGYPKKSFGVTLDTPARWPGLRESGHWVLNAAFIDRSLATTRDALHKISQGVISVTPAFPDDCKYCDFVDACRIQSAAPAALAFPEHLDKGPDLAKENIRRRAAYLAVRPEVFGPAEP